MVATIGNPLTWGARAIGRTGSGVAAATRELGGNEAAPQVRAITIGDLKEALRKGVDDFTTMRTDVAVMCLLYPIIGTMLTYLAVHRNLIHLVFPMASGFALLGPAFAVGLYEMSRKRETEGRAGWSDAFGVLRAPAFWAIVVLGLALMALFVVWMVVAGGIYRLTMGSTTPVSVTAFIHDVLATRQGWALIGLGIPVGAVFALVVLVVSFLSFPMLVDRAVGLPMAVVTSFRVARKSPATVLAWGLIVGVSLLAGSIPLFLGLAVVLPVLGHATWHLYRRAVV